MRDLREERAERPDEPIFRIGSALISMTVIGAAMGAVRATWSNFKITKAGGRGAAFLQVLKVMADSGLTFGAMGTAFAATDVIAESFREKKDMVNPALGSVAGGLVLGIRVGSPSFAAGAAAAAGACSIGMDLFGGQIRGPPGFGDGKVAQRKFIGE